MQVRAKNNRITYQKLFWLFMIGSVLGVLVEGFWCLFQSGRWETHVVSVWGPFCIVYGIGAVGFYVGAVELDGKRIAVKFAVSAFVGAAIELICGSVLKYGLHMKAWDYTGRFLNIDGMVSFNMTVLWGLLGVFFMRFLASPAQTLLGRMQGKRWHVACICLTVFMIVNFSLTSVCIVRWKDRHEGIAPRNRFEEMIDSAYNDSTMQKRFCEWHFIGASSK